MISESTSNYLYSFVKYYNNTYGKLPRSEAILAYDSMNLIKDAMIRYGKPSCTSTIVQDRIGLRNELENTNNFASIDGGITFDSNNDPIDRCVNIYYVDDHSLPAYYYAICGEQ
mmetsp:Transcript_3015/g.4540  ORF Transcript_3015/g.4540 Transcript_3015/m.4540 type:complete len:114 (-) Transcript_3015:4789-5130(-)